MNEKMKELMKQAGIVFIDDSRLGEVVYMRMDHDDLTKQGKKLKTKPATKNEKLVEVFEMTWAGYKGSGGYEGYTCIPELKGSSLEDLGEKLESYLSNLVEVLNRRVVECEHCNGTGHLVENVSCKFL